MRRAETFEAFSGNPRRVPMEWSALRNLIGWYAGRGHAWLVAAPNKGGSLWSIQTMGACERPVRLWLVATFRRDGRPFRPLAADRLVRCRKCKGCGSMKAAEWARRARAEYQGAARTWMGTLTVAPDQHALIDAQIASDDLWPARSRLSDEAWSQAVFRLRARYLGQHVSTWLDLNRRIAAMRGSVAGEIRYLMVAEAHASGLPHVHILMHELRGGFLVRGSAVMANPVDNGDVVFRKYKLASGEYKLGAFVADEALVRKTWELGHSKFQLCFDAKEAYYLCKYMSKDLGGLRVRASIGYGAVYDEVGGTKDKPEKGSEQGEAEAKAHLDPPESQQ